MIKVKEYKSYNYGFPSDDIDPEEKEKAPYCLAFSEAFLSLYFRNEFEITWQERDEMFVLRKYGVGDQAEDTVMKMCYGTDDGYNVLRKGWMNINWEILKISPKFRNAYLGMFSDIDFEILCESQDLTSKKEKEDKAWGLYTQKKLRPIMMQQMGVEIPASELPEPDSEQELLIYQQLGVYKNQFELASEQFLRASFSIFSNWDLETKRMVLEDLWDIGKAVVKDSLDKQTQKIKAEYCDVANTVIRRDHEGRVLDGGVIQIKSIADVRVEAALCGYPISEEELMNAGMASVNAFGNPANWEFGRDAPLYDSSLNRWVYDNWKVAVFDCEYRTSDTKFYTEKTKEGKKTYYTEKYGKEWKESGSKKTITKAKINYYRCKLLMGTKCVYDYGKQYDIPRPDKSEALSSFHYVKLPGFSPVKNIKPILDQVQLAWVKFQNAWAKARPDGWMYDESALINSTLGSKLKPDELVRMSEQTGRLFIKSTDKWKHPTMSPNAGNPVIPMPGGIGNALNEFVATWNLMISMLQEMTGLTPQASASPLPADTGKAVSEIQLASTTNILKPIINEYKRLKQSLAKTMLLRGMLTFKFSKEISKDYYDVLGETTVELLRTASKTAAQMGVNLVPKTSAEIRQKLERNAELAMQSGRDGVPQLTLPEFNMIMMLIDSSAPPRYIQAIMSKMINEREQLKEQQKQALIKLQGDENQKNTIVATEGAKSAKSFETTEEMRKEAFKTMMDIIRDKSKAENALDLESGIALIQQQLQNLSTPPQTPTSPQV